MVSRRGLIQSIESRQNPRYKALRKLAPGFGGDWIVVEGKILNEEAVRAGLRPESLWFSSIDDSTSLPGQITGTADRFILPEAMYTTVSPTRSGRAPLGVYQSPILEEADLEHHRTGRYLLLDRIQDPGNAGALIRAATAFGFDGVLLRRPCVFPYHHACIRASAGTVFHIPIHLIEDGLCESGLYLVGAAADAAHAVEDFPWPEDLILVMGNEGQGLDPVIEKCLNASIRIPISKKVESLNVAGAAHILMYHLRR